MDLEKLIYEMLKEGKSVKEISDATLNAQKKISEEQKSEKLIADCRADLVGATITYLKALGLESFFERAIEYLDEETDVDEMIVSFWNQLYNSIKEKEPTFKRMLNMKIKDVNTTVNSFLKFF